MAKDGLWTSPMSRSEKGVWCFRCQPTFFMFFFIVSERAFFTMAFFPACVAGVISNKVCVSTVLVRLEISCNSAC